MGTDYFSILGLAPGRYDPAEVTRRFQTERTRLLAALRNPATAVDARRKLDCLHMAYAVLRDPRGQESILQARRSEDNDLTQLRRLVAASLEDGLLRFSRRQEILAEARRLGLSDFQTQLLIAQVQFGDDQISLFDAVAKPPPHREARRAWAGLAAAGALALALFLALVRWLEV